MLVKSDRNQQKQLQPNLSLQIREVHFGLVTHHCILPTAIIDLYLFSTKFIDTNPAGAEGFVKGIFKAMDFMKTNKSEALVITGKRLQISPEEVEAQLKGVRLIDLPTNVKMLSDSQSDIYLLNHLNEVSEFLIEQKQVFQLPDMTKILEPKHKIKVRDVALQRLYTEIYTFN